MKSDFTFFWKNRSPFSNWYPSKFTHNGVNFTRGEQYMMYQKAILFGDTAIANAILATDNPAEQKELGRMVSNYDDAVWAAKRVDIMIEGLYEKFYQNSKLKSALLDTGDTIIVEASPVDTIWGIGLAEDDPLAWDQSTWRGQNLLGIVLMAVRDKINEDFKVTLSKGTVAEDRVYPWLKSRYSYVVDFRYQRHEQNKGPRLEGTSGSVVLPDFFVADRFNGNILIDVKSKESVYSINGKKCFTVDDYRLIDYLKCAELMKVDKVMLIFVYEDELYFYDAAEAVGLHTFNNGYGRKAYLFEYSRAKIKK